MTTYFMTTVPSPCGPLGLIVDEAGAVRRIEFDRDRSFDSYRRRLAASGRKLVAGTDATAELRRQLDEYFAGERRDFDLVLAPEGSPFQLRVWEELRRIPFGETRSYSEIATAIGHLEAVRAVGAANGANPIPIVVPCHRVIGADGSLTGFGGGLDNKRLLLDLEGVPRRRSALPRALQMSLDLEAG